MFIEKEKEHEVAWVGDWDASGRTWGRENNYDQNTIYKKMQKIIKIHIKLKILKIYIKKLNVFSVYLNQNISCSWNVIE